jgi:hypothetical protein
MPREHAEGEKGGEQDRVGKSKLKGYLRDLIEDVLKDKIEGGPIFNEIIHPLEEEHNDVNEDQAAQG